MTKICPICNKEIIAINEKQLEYNFYAHAGSQACKSIKLNQEVKKK